MGERRQLQRLAAVWLLLLAAVACHARPQDAATTKPGVDNVVTSGALPTTTTTTAAKDAQQEKEVARDVSNRYSRHPTGLSGPGPTGSVRSESSSQSARGMRGSDPSLWRANFLQLSEAIKSVSKTRSKTVEPFSSKNASLDPENPYSITQSTLSPYIDTGNQSHSCNQTSSGCDAGVLVDRISGLEDDQKEVAANFSYPSENGVRNPLILVDTIYKKPVGGSKTKLRRISSSGHIGNRWNKIAGKTLDDHSYVRIDDVILKSTSFRDSDESDLRSHVMLNSLLKEKARLSDDLSSFSSEQITTPLTLPIRQFEYLKTECVRCESSGQRENISTNSRSSGKQGQLVSYIGRLLNKSDAVHRTSHVSGLRHQLKSDSTENSAGEKFEGKSIRYVPHGYFSSDNSSFSVSNTLSVADATVKFSKQFSYLKKKGDAVNCFGSNCSSAVRGNVSLNNGSVRMWNDSELPVQEMTRHKFKPAEIHGKGMGKVEQVSNTLKKMQLRDSIPTADKNQNEGVSKRLVYINDAGQISPRVLRDGNYMEGEKTIQDGSSEVITGLRNKDDAEGNENTRDGLIHINDGGDVTLLRVFPGGNYTKGGKKINDGSIELVTNFIANSLPDLKTPAASALTRPGPKPLPTDLYVPVPTTSKTDDSGVKTWPGDNGIQSLDDLIMYHTYTDNRPSSDHHQSHHQGPVLIQQHHDGAVTGVIQKPVTLGSSSWTNAAGHWDDHYHHQHTTTRPYPLYHHQTEPPKKKPVIIIVEEPSTNGYFPPPPSTTPKYDYTVQLHQPVATRPPHYSPSNSPPVQSTNGCPSILITASGSVNNANGQKDGCGEVSIVINSEITNTNSIGSQSAPGVVQPTSRPPLGDDDYEAPGSDEEGDDEEGEEDEDEDEEETTSKPSKPQRPVKPVRPHKPHRPHKPSQTAVSSGSGGYFDTLLTSTSTLNPLSINFWKMVFAPLAMLVIGGFGLMFLMFPWMFAGLVWRRTFGWRRQALRREDDLGRLEEPHTRVTTTSVPFPWRCDGRRCNYSGKLWQDSKGSRRKKRSSWSYSPYRGWLMGT